MPKPEIFHGTVLICHVKLQPDPASNATAGKVCADTGMVGLRSPRNAMLSVAQIRQKTRFAMFSASRLRKTTRFAMFPAARLRQTPCFAMLSARRLCQTHTFCEVCCPPGLLLDLLGSLRLARTPRASKLSQNAMFSAAHVRQTTRFATFSARRPRTTTRFAMFLVAGLRQT